MAGTTAAETIRRGDPHASIALFEKEEEFLYSRVMLPNFIRGKYNRDAIFLRKRDDYIDQQIDLFRGKQVQAIDAEKSEVSFGGNEYVHYGKLLIAMGGVPREWNVETPKNLPIFHLQTLADAERIKSFIAEQSDTPRRVAVVGGGFIGLEFVESFVSAGIGVDLFLREGHCFAGRVSEGFAEAMEYIHRGKDIVLHKNSQIDKIIQKSETIFEVVADTGNIEVHAVALGIGIERNLDIAKKAGLNAEMGIQTNQYLKTSNENIFAIGDIAQYARSENRESMVSGTWVGATSQGIVGGENASGKKVPLEHIPTYAITHLGVHIAFIGEHWNEKMEVVVRDGGTHNPYAEFYFGNGTLKGATLVNMPRAVGLFLRLITEGKTTLAQREKLESTEIDFAEIENE